MNSTAPGPSGGEPPRGWAAGPSPRTATLLLVLLSVPLLFAGLGSYSLVNGDEAIYRLISLRMLDTGDWFRLHDGVEPRVYDTFMNAPLHYWARALLYTALGEGLAVSRLLSAVFGLATVLVTHRLALWLAPSASPGSPESNGRWAAFLAGLVQLTTYQFIWLHGARTGELETLVSFLVTAALLLFLRAVRSGGSFLLHHACLGALLMTKLPLPLLPVAAELCWFALTPSARPHLRRWLVQGLALLPLALAWHAAQALRLGDAFGQVLGTMAHEARSGSVGHEAGRTSNWSYYARRLPFAVYPWGLLYPFAFLFALLSGRPGGRPGGRADEQPGTSNGPADGAELRLLALFVLIVGAFYLAVEKHAPWYPTPAYPALAVCIGLMLASLARGSRAPRAALIAAALCLALLPWLDVSLLSHQPFDRTAQQMGMRARWLGPDGLAPGLAVALTSAAALALLVLIARRGSGTRVALALALPFVLVAIVRCLAPLQHLGYQSDLAQVRSRIDHRLTAGEPMRYPVALPAAQPWIVRATFIRDHRIVDRRNQPDVDPAAVYLIFAGTATDAPDERAPR